MGLTKPIDGVVDHVRVPVSWIESTSEVGQLRTGDEIGSVVVPETP